MFIRCIWTTADAQQVIPLYEGKWFEAKQPAELHMYEKDGHGFGMKKNNITTDAWTEQLIFEQK